jgi:hypothetical protein
MAQYKLIKLEEGNTVVSDESTKPNSFYINLHDFNIGKYGNEQAPPQSPWVKKVIASDFHPELPSINYNGLEEELGIIDVEKLLEYQNLETTIERLAFKSAFKKAQSLNDKKFSLDDMLLAMGYAAGMDKNTPLDYLRQDAERFIQSLQQPTTFDIEGALENNVFKITKLC